MGSRGAGIGAWVLGAALLASGCAGREPGEFTVALPGDIESLDPGRSWDVTSLQVTSVFAESLLAFGRSGGEGGGADLVPCLAASWRQVDELTYVYEIRPDVRFSDGTPMTMDDVLFSLERSRAGADGGFFAGLWAEVEAFSAEGWTLTVRLRRPQAVFRYVPATGAARIVSRAHYEKHRPDGTAEGFGGALGGVVGTGPYVWERWTPGEEIVFSLNRRYWNRSALEKARIERLVFRIIPEAAKEDLALQSGSVDFALNLTLNQYKDLLSGGAAHVFKVNGGRVTYLALNCSRPPMSDVNVRRAVYHALDFERYTREYLGEEGLTPIVLPFSAEAYGASIYGENTDKWAAFEQSLAARPVYDLEKSLSLLGASAYPEGFDCALVVPDLPFEVRRAWFVRDSLSPLGIRVNVRAVPVDDWTNLWRVGRQRDARGRRDYDMIFTCWTPDYPDIEGIAAPLYASTEEASGYNCAAYANSEVDALLAADSAEQDAERRFELQRRFVEIALDELPYIPFENLYQFGALNKAFALSSLATTWPWSFPFHAIR